MTGIDWTPRRPPIQDRYRRMQDSDREPVVLCDKTVPDMRLCMPTARIFCVKKVCHRGRHKTATGHEWETDDEMPVQRPWRWG